MARKGSDWSISQRLGFILITAAAGTVLPLAVWLCMPPSSRGGGALQAELGVATAFGLVLIAAAGLLGLRALRRRIRRLEAAAHALALGDVAAARSAAGDTASEPQRDELMRAVRELAGIADLLQRRETGMSECARFSAAIASSLDATRIAEKGLEPLAALVGAQSGVIYVLDPDISALRQLSAWSATPEGIAAGPARRICARALRERTALVVHPFPESGCTCSTLLAIPMVLQERPVGILCLGRLSGDFEANSVRLAEAAARTLALSLQNALLHRSMEKLTLELKEANGHLQARNALLEERAEEVRAQNGALLRQADELALADRRKTELLAAVAHELRNPLAAVSNAVRLLDEGAAQAEAAERARAVIRRQASLLSRLVEDLLDASRISSGQLELRKRRVDLAEVARLAAEVSAPALRRKAHALDIDFSATQLWSEGDPDRLQQIVGNLLHNAVKYTDPGGRIRLSLRREGDQVSVVVTDNGIGVAPEQLPRIFDLFMQVDPNGARGEGGLGIGLALVRKLVELHGGTVAARSAGLGKGCEIEVRLPAAQEPEHEPEERPGTASSSRPLRVLVLEDDRDLAESMAELLRGWGHDVMIQNEAGPAIEAAVASPPDVVLMDIGLPGTDGYAVARELRARLPGASRTRLIALTGYSQPADRRRAQEAGFDLHFTKPVDFDALRDALAGSERPASTGAAVNG